MGQRLTPGFPFLRLLGEQRSLSFTKNVQEENVLITRVIGLETNVVHYLSYSDRKGSVLLLLIQ